MIRSEKRNIGLLAHVDAGKTTLAERILLESGMLKKAGRVDHRDAFLDTDETEKRRGITIYSKMAQTQHFTLIDTPGHTDFSAEMERTLQILDYAILIISGPDGLQGHVLTLWKLLMQYEVPTVIFVNKMDQPGTDRSKIMKELKGSLDEGCVDWNDFDPEAEQMKLPGEIQEETALLEESLLERYLEGEEITFIDAQELFTARKLFPCWFGSALKGDGVRPFLLFLERFLPGLFYPDEFSARIFKISRDSNGRRLTWMKVTGGVLRAKQTVQIPPETGEIQKVQQVMIWSGMTHTQVPEASAGTVAAVSGLEQTAAGMGLGAEPEGLLPLLEPVLTYRIVLPEGCDVHETFRNLRPLEEEFPELHLQWNAEAQEIHVQVMGQVQIEILTEQIRQRFGLSVSFDEGRIVYRETIHGTAEGVGHYEPLRHYAEVHLILEGLPAGSGLMFDSEVSTDDLALNWQRLILTHLEEKQHAGVLTGSCITDMRITLAAGRAHEKHTEGGDFRQAVYRAVRAGLMQARADGQCELLEPVYAFRLEVPDAEIGRAMTDIRKRNGTFETNPGEPGFTVLTGRAPVSEMREYQKEVSSYTGGRGRFFARPDGYMPCHNTQEVLEMMHYDPDADTQNPSGSVFCSHGAGLFVPWYEVADRMHLEAAIDRRKAGEENGPDPIQNRVSGGPAFKSGPSADDSELMEIFRRTFRSGEKGRSWKKTRREWDLPAKRTSPAKSRGKEILLVDGYNIIFAWKDLKELAEVNLDAARAALADILANYRGYRAMTLILVYDAYKVENGTERVLDYSGIHIVYTREAETADAYIERSVRQAPSGWAVTVATSDAAEQMIIWGEGARRMSARELREEIEAAGREIRQQYLDRQVPSGRRYLFSGLDQELKKRLEILRLGGR